MASVPLRCSGLNPIPKSRGSRGMASPAISSTAFPLARPWEDARLAPRRDLSLTQWSRRRRTGRNEERVSLRRNVQSQESAIWTNQEAGRGCRGVSASMAGSATAVGSFRAGQKRPEVRVPSLALFLDASQCTGDDKVTSQETLGLLDAAVAGGVTLVVLQSGKREGGSSSSVLFEAACAVKGVLRGRAPLLVWERADIAAAAGAEGVLLSDQGLPAVAARRMMEGMAVDSSVLPLVGRHVASVDAAVRASAADGADLIVLSLPRVNNDMLTSAKDEASSSGVEEEAKEEEGGMLETEAENDGTGSSTTTRIEEAGTSVTPVESSSVAEVLSVREESYVKEMSGVREAVGSIRGAQVTVPLLLDYRGSSKTTSANSTSLDTAPDLDAELAKLQGLFQGTMASGASGAAFHLADVAQILSRDDGPGARAAVARILSLPMSQTKGNEATAAKYLQEEVPATSQEKEGLSGMPEEAETAVEDSEESTGQASGAPEGNTAAETAVGSEGAEAVTERGSSNGAAQSDSVPSQLGTPVASPVVTPEVTPEVSPEVSPVTSAVTSPGVSPVATPLEKILSVDPWEAEAGVLLGAERQLLNKFLSFLSLASPEMAEVGLLEDSVARLADPFLVVIVGEFNSGKSSLINALLGGKFLKVGAVPTTNEITLIRHSSDAEGDSGGTESTDEKQNKQEREIRSEDQGKVMEQRHPDGHILRYLPADLLKQMNIVDTPGTNVILERQQRLTEEFVPQADLVLFILSADRPLADSEVSFLRYIKQWGKKVVFVLNKIDLLDENEEEVDTVYSFVCDNVKRLLGADTVTCFPVSSRLALSSKSLPAQPSDIERMAASWKASRFGELEEFILSFLEGSSDAGAERLRLKLDTPLGVGAALLAACQRQLSEERSAADVDAEALQKVDPQMVQFREAMRADSELQQSRIVALVEEARARADAIVDETLQASNVEVLSQYLFSPAVSPDSQLPVLSTFQTQVVGSSFADVRRALFEHFEWLQSNNQRQLAGYVEFAESRWPNLATFLSVQQKVETPSSSPSSPKGTAGASGDRDAAAEGAGAGGEDGAPLAYPELQTVAALEGFDTNAAALLLEEELRLAVVGLVTGFGAAGVSASVLTSVFSNPLEDMLALALCSAGGALGILNLPGKREEVKKKIRRAAHGLVKQLTKKLNEELEVALDRLQDDVERTLKPYKGAVEAELERVSSLQADLDLYAVEIENLRQRVRNIGS